MFIYINEVYFFSLHQYMLYRYDGVANLPSAREGRGFDHGYQYVSINTRRPMNPLTCTAHRLVVTLEHSKLAHVHVLLMRFIRIFFSKVQDTVHSHGCNMELPGPATVRVERGNLLRGCCSIARTARVVGAARH